MIVEVTFDGDYYGADELIPLMDRWIRQGLDDRSDLDYGSIKTTGEVRKIK